MPDDAFNKSPAALACVLDRPVGRSPGYYWTRHGADWQPMEWTGKSWWGIAMQRAMSPDEIDEIGPELTPPNFKAQERP